MGGWRTAYEWTRAILAVLGAIGCGLVLLVALIVFGQVHDRPDESEMEDSPAAPRLPFAGADSLLNQAGIDRATQSLQLIGENAGEWMPGDHSNIQLYCLKAEKLPLGPRWAEPSQLEPMMVLASKATFDAAHAANGCVPSWTDAVWQGMRVQPMQLSWSQRQLGFANLALYDPENEILYLVSRTTPTSPPVAAAVQPAPAPSTE